MHVPITNLIPSYDSRQGRFRQVPVGHSWRAVGAVPAISRPEAIFSENKPMKTYGLPTGGERERFWNERVGWEIDGRVEREELYG